jgi:chromosome segregation protein
MSGEIRRLEALIYAIGHAEARAQATAAERQASQDFAAVADRTREQAEAATAQAVAAHLLPGLREAEAAAAAALQRLTHARNELDAEERRAKDRLAELDRHVADLDRDIARQTAAQADAAATIARLAAEAAEITQDESAEAARSEAEARLAQAEESLAKAEAELNALQAQVSDLNARRGALERTRREELLRADRFAQEKNRIERDMAALQAAASGASLDTLRADCATAGESLVVFDARAAEARAALAEARESEARARGPSRKPSAPHSASKQKPEPCETLHPDDRRPVSADARRRHGRARVRDGPRRGARGGSRRLLQRGRAGALGHAGRRFGRPRPARGRARAGRGRRGPARARAAVAADRPGRALSRPGARRKLHPGQRLVSREGDLWRWDGLTAAAEAPSPAARRLAERNRLGELERDAAAARKVADSKKAELDSRPDDGARRCGGRDGGDRGGRRGAAALDVARERLGRAERREADVAAKRSGLREGLERLAASEAEARERVSDAERRLADLHPRPTSRAVCSKPAPRSRSAG